MFKQKKSQMSQCSVWGWGMDFYFQLVLVSVEMMSSKWLTQIILKGVTGTCSASLVPRYPLHVCELSSVGQVLHPNRIKPITDQGFIFSFLLCSSRKYPYPHHGGKFMQVPPPPRNFHFLNTKITPHPSLLWNFHMFYVHPPYPLEKDSFGGKVIIT